MHSMDGNLASCSDSRKPAWSRAGALVLALMSVVSCAAPQTATNIQSATEGRQDVADLYIVDCLLPGQVRVVGGRTFLTPRRPTRTTTADCRIRGGEYTAYDRANLKSALNVWMADAEGGDADAQNNVGEIFERGLGDEPNYEAAVIWYQKAADQGHPAAQLNLGTLYEQGLGVPKDKLIALNLYRQSWGLDEGDIVFEAAVNDELRRVRGELQRLIDEKDTQIRLLQRQIGDFESRGQLAPDAEQELVELRAWVQGLRSDKSSGEQQLARTREPSAEAIPADWSIDSRTVSEGSRDFGRYYALIIGNQDYERMEDLASPLSDAVQVAEILEKKYGFTVQLIQNANDITILQAINNLSGLLDEDDNLLIYYAGHGSRRGRGEYEAGYWLPVNADRPPDDTYWVPTSQITDHLATIKAKRVLVLADSCYAGILSNEPGTSMVGSDANVLNHENIVRRRMPRRSRLLVSSGGDQPVLDTSGTGNSVFANAFIAELEANDGVLTTPSLYVRLRDRVRRAAAEQDFSQVPELKVIKRAGHEVGDFFFVPSANWSR